MSIKIGSFNLKNNFFLCSSKNNDDMKQKSFIFTNYIKENKLDLIGTQELTFKYKSELSSRLKNYKFYGDYRYGNVFKKFPYNENNNIITNQKVLFTKTIWLPWIPKHYSELKTGIVKISVMPRIATIIIVEDGNLNQFCVINTHLDYEIPQIQKRQLGMLNRVVHKYEKEYPIILTGDFNMEPQDEHFNNFIMNLKETQIERVPISENTWYDKNKNGKTIDHIFLSSDWDIENMGVKSLEEISDHKMVYVTANMKRKRY